jgi:small subunit ribosomal protein S18
LANGASELKTNGEEVTADKDFARNDFFLAMQNLSTFFDPLMTSEEPRQKNPLELTHTDVETLTRYVTDTGKILPRRITGFTALQQRHLTRVIKQARNLLLMK